MIPYLLFTFCSLLLSLFESSKLQRLVFICFSFCLLVFVSFRYGGTGPKDYDAYIRLYESIVDWSSVLDPEIHAEVGFRILSFAGNYLGYPGHFIIFSMGVLSLLPILYLINKYSRFKFTSLLVWVPYILTMNMHSSRISVAAAFCLLFFVFIFEKRLFFAVLSLAIAISFHTSSVAALLVFFVFLSLNQLCRLGFFFFISCSFISPLQMISEIFAYTGFEKMSWLISSYALSSDYGYRMPVYDPRILLNLFILFLIFNMRDGFKDKFESYLMKVTVIGISILFVFSSVTIISWRVSYLFILTSVLSLPVLCFYYNSYFYSIYGRSRVLSSFFLFVYFVYCIPLIYGSLPYQFYF